MERQVEDMWMKMTEWERIWSHWPLAVNRTLLPLSEEESRGEEMQKHKGLQIKCLEVGGLSAGFFFSCEARK